MAAPTPAVRPAMRMLGVIGQFDANDPLPRDLFRIDPQEKFTELAPKRSRHRRKLLMPLPDRNGLVQLLVKCN